MGFQIDWSVIIRFLGFSRLKNIDLADRKK